MLTEPEKRMTNWLVTLVDDDRQYLDDYKRGLEHFCRHKGNMEIRVFFDAAEALDSVTPEAAPPHWLWIMDSMMPFDNDRFQTEETEQGLLTGIVLLKKISSRLAGRIHPHFLIVTNYDIEAVRKGLAGVETDGIYRKLQCSPKRVARLVDEIIEADGNPLRDAV
jgi:hypothetical protein